MSDFDYLIVGGGEAANAAAHGIRELDASGSIGIISAEADEPYDRTALTKALFKLAISPVNMLRASAGDHGPTAVALSGTQPLIEKGCVFGQMSWPSRFGMTGLH